MNILIVRLGALGDVVHAVPAVAALRRKFPAAQIDWLVDARHRDFVELVTPIDRIVVVERRSASGWLATVRELRRVSYDVAIDLQGLLKSAVLARGSGAARVIGFSIWHLREKAARPFYSSAQSARPDHVIRMNLRLLEAVGIHDEEIRFPLAAVKSPALSALRERVPEGRRFAVINPGAAWPNKQWGPGRFGELASFLYEECGLCPVIVWGPGEERLADAVLAASANAAIVAPPTSVADLVALCRAAALVVSGDTGPLHIAGAVGAPTVSIFGPTDPERNGPWLRDDIAVSRFDRCGCRYDRRCHQAQWCLADVSLAEVCAAVQRRLSVASSGPSSDRGARG